MDYLKIGVIVLVGLMVLIWCFSLRGYLYSSHPEQAEKSKNRLIAATYSLVIPALIWFGFSTMLEWFK